MSTAKGRDYSKSRYWEREKPKEATTASLYFAYYRKAGKLQVRRHYVNKYGEAKRGAHVTIDRRELRQDPAAVSLLRRVLNDVALVDDE